MSSGLVGIIANDAGRFSLFSACATKLRTPEGSKLEWCIGGDWCGARNDLVRQAIEEEHDWLWFMDDDHAFAPNLLERLLEHNVPLVMPFCLQRVYPFAPVFSADGHLSLDVADYDGLVEVRSGGCAGMLIKREVLLALEEPWFEYADRSEDVIFCEKAREAGFPLYVDFDARLGHITTAVVWPSEKDGEWVTGFTIGHELNLFAPFAMQEAVA